MSNTLTIVVFASVIAVEFPLLLLFGERMLRHLDRGAKVGSMTTTAHTEPHPPGPSCPRPECSTFDGWLIHHCYACGGDLSQPRQVRRSELPHDARVNPGSHRWCFE